MKKNGKDARRTNEDWESVDKTKDFFGPGKIQNENDTSVTDTFGKVDDSFGGFARPTLEATRELDRKFSRVAKAYHK